MTGRILDVKGLTKRFGGFVALDAVDLHVDDGERLGLIGPNGSGKTTMINCISGALFNDQGTITFNGDDITRLAAYSRTRQGIARSFQIPRPFRTMTILQNLLIPMEYTASQREHGGNPEAEARDILDLVGFGGRADENSGRLTQVDLRKLELAAFLVASTAVAALIDHRLQQRQHLGVGQTLVLAFAARVIVTFLESRENQANDPRRTLVPRHRCVLEGVAQLLPDHGLANRRFMLST